MPIMVQCMNCKTELRRKPSRATDGFSFCDIGCRVDWQKKQSRETIPCDVCNKPVERLRSKRKPHTFCSRACTAKWKARKQNVAHCANCGKEMRRKPSQKEMNHAFCSFSCLSDFTKNRVVTKCSNCSKKLEVVPSRVSARNFCDKKCRGEWETVNRQGERSGNWQGGVSFDPYPPEFNNQLKRKIRARDNYHCQMCGKSQIVAGRALDVHHINYDKSDCREVNLIATCSSCNLRANAKRTIWRVILSVYQRARGIS